MLNTTKKLSILSLMLTTSIAATACSANDDVVLGSRDDIIIMKNGVPVDGSPAMPSAQTLSATAPTMPTIDGAIEAAEAIETTASQAADLSQMSAAKKAMAKDAVLDKAKEMMADAMPSVPKTPAVPAIPAAPVVTENQVMDTMPAKAMVETKANEAVESVKQKAATAMAPVTTIEGMKEMPTIAVPTTPTPTAVAKSELKRMDTAVMKSAVASEAPVTAADADTPIQETAKATNSCYKNTLVPEALGVGNKLTTMPKIEERRIVCASDMSPALVMSVQKALNAKGYNVGVADGKLGHKTAEALLSFQKRNNLGLGGFTFETLEALNVKP